KSGASAGRVQHPRRRRGRARRQSRRRRGRERWPNRQGGTSPAPVYLPRGGSLMKIWRVMALAPAIILAAACHKNDNRTAADTSLNRDLNLANQVAPYDSISPTEAGYAKAPAAGLTSPRTTASRATTTRRTTTRRSSSGSRGSSGTVYSSSGGTVVSPAP